MFQRANVLEAASSLLDARARLLGHQLVAGTLTREEAAAKILAAAVDTGVVRQMCDRHHRGLARTRGFDEVNAAVTSMLAHYALGGPGREGHLDPARFADSLESAAGWIGKVVGSMRTTRILREMSVDSRELASPMALERAAVSSAEDAVLAASVPEVNESTRGLPATSATIRLVHASALHQLLGLPPLRPWKLTHEQRADLLVWFDEDPDVPRRVLSEVADGISSSARESIGLLWAGWSRDDVAAMLAKSTPESDIPHVLASAALRPLPRPTARSGDLDRLRARARDGAPSSAAEAAPAVFEAFLDSQVEAYTDFDRIRRRRTATEVARREASREVFPDLLQEAAQLLGIDEMDLLSGLIGLFIGPLPVANPAYFAPTPWRFPA